MKDDHRFPSMQDDAPELIDDLVTPFEAIIDDHISHDWLRYL